MQKSQSMTRSKEQLKNQLLISFRKQKRYQQVASIQQNLKSTVVGYSAPQNYRMSNNNSYFQNKSILDQFSRCPIRQDEYLYSGQQFLNKFMYVKNRPVFPTEAKTSISIQTQKCIKPQFNNIIAQTNTKSQKQEKLVSSPQIRVFDEKNDKSLIDVSANLDNYKFQTSNTKYQHKNQRILTDSIIKDNNKSEEKIDNSAQQLLNQLEKAESENLSFALQQKKTSAIQKKQPIIRKIQLSKPKNMQKTSSLSQKSEYKQNNIQNYEKKQMFKDQFDEKLQKLLSKKSSIKDLIVKKGEQKRMQVEKELQNQKIGDKQTSSKWNIPLKTKNSAKSQSSINTQKNTNNKLIQQIDPTDLLSPYQSSTSGLQAVIQQQNESQMEQSVRSKQAQPEKIQPQLQKINTKSKNQPINIQNKKQNQKLNNIRAQAKLQNQKNEQSPEIQSLSQADFSLQNISEIEVQSGNKKILDKSKQTGSKKQISDELPDYQDSQNQQKHKKQVLNMKKYVANDINNDINNLRKKIAKDTSFQQESHAQSEKNKPQTLQIQARPVPSAKGSSGPNSKVESMLDFFDQVHDKIDFGQVSKDIADLRDRIANQSD